MTLYRHCITGLLFFLLILLTSDSWSAKPLSLSEIDESLTTLRHAKDSLSALHTSLKRDSIQLATSDAGSETKNRIAGIEKQIAAKTKEAVEIRERHGKAVKDSSDIDSEISGKIATAEAEINRLKKESAATSRNLKLLYGQRQKAQAETRGGNDREIVSLEAEIRRRDSIVSTKQKVASRLTEVRSRLVKDSIETVAKRDGFHRQHASRARALDMEIASAKSALSQDSLRFAASRASREKEAARIREEATQLNRQAKENNDKISRLSGEIESLAAEKKRLAKSANAAVASYQKLREPFSKASEEAEKAFRDVDGRKKTLFAVRAKLSLDSAVAKARDALDNAIQLSAKNKRKGAKLVRKREEELNELSSRMDSIVHSVRGVRQTEAQFRAATLSQRMGLVDKAIADHEAKVAPVMKRFEQAKQKLADFDRANPAPEDPSSSRIREIDGQATAKRQEIDRLRDSIASLTARLQEAKSAYDALGASLQEETTRQGDEIRKKENALHALLDKRSALSQDSAANDNVYANRLREIASRTDSIGGKVVSLNGEITLHSREAEKSRQKLLTTKEKNNNAHKASQAEVTRLDDLIAAGKKESAGIDVKISSLNEEIASLRREREQKLDALNPSPAGLASRYTALAGEVATLGKQKAAVEQEESAGASRQAAALREMSLNIASVSKSIAENEKQTSMLDAARKNALASLEKEKRIADSTAQVLERRIADLFAARDKARKDSGAIENDLRTLSQRFSAAAAAEDPKLITHRQKLAEAQRALSAARKDSVQKANGIPSALQRFQQEATTLERSIAAKEKELAALKSQREKVMQEALSERKRQTALLADAHEEIIQRARAVGGLETQLTLLEKARHEKLRDTVAERARYQESLKVAIRNIERQNDSIAKLRAEVARLRAISGRPVAVSSDPYSPPSSAERKIAQTPPPKQISPAALLAQKQSETIYTLLGNNKVRKAAKQFKKLRPILQKNLVPEAYEALKTTIQQMGGKVK